MKKKRPNKVLMAFALLGILFIFATGCDKRTKHKVLTFFFTGVPPLEEGKQDETVENTQVVMAKTKNNKKRIKPQVSVFSHGPYGAGQCYLCHDISTSASFKTFPKKKSPGIAGQGRGVPGRLVAPLKELCAECHPQKSAQAAHSKDLWSHGPAANGDCTACHNPHRSAFQYMLLREKTTELCTQCHSSGYILQTEEHTNDRECISCHNPHMGKNRFLLKKDFNEMF
ncbi:MAG: cytochrome c3 family protein [Candidatus Mariimomonas ferrooxydans]